MTTHEPSSAASLIFYQTEDGQTRVQCRFEDETLWLTQAQMAELIQTTPQNVTQHLKAILAEGELNEMATCREYLQVRQEGGHEVSRSLRHYNLSAILAVGYRERSHRGTQFRQWATARLSEYLVKRTMEDERLKNPPVNGQKDYFVVIPAHAGIQQKNKLRAADKAVVPLRGNDLINWIPACAGMTVEVCA